MGTWGCFLHTKLLGADPNWFNVMCGHVSGHTHVCWVDTHRHQSKPAGVDGSMSTGTLEVPRASLNFHIVHPAGPQPSLKGDRESGSRHGPEEATWPNMVAKCWGTVYHLLLKRNNLVHPYLRAQEPHSRWEEFNHSSVGNKGPEVILRSLPTQEPLVPPAPCPGQPPGSASRAGTFLFQHWGVRDKISIEKSSPSANTFFLKTYSLELANMLLWEASCFGINRRLMDISRSKKKIYFFLRWILAM